MDEIKDLDEFRWAVDIPQTFDGDPTDEWKTVEYFENREDAIKFAQEHFGADEDGMICLISSF